jgi:hypothetical protein
MPDKDKLLSIASAIEGGPNELTISQCENFSAALRDIAGRMPDPKPEDQPVEPPTGG